MAVDENSTIWVCLSMRVLILKGAIVKAARYSHKPFWSSGMVLDAQEGVKGENSMSALHCTVDLWFATNTQGERRSDRAPRYKNF